MAARAYPARHSASKTRVNELLVRRLFRPKEAKKVALASSTEFMNIDNCEGARMAGK
jgi:hypothetical protein